MERRQSCDPGEGPGGLECQVAGSTSSIWGWLALEMGKRRGDGRREARCPSATVGTRRPEGGGRGGGGEGELRLENAGCSAPVGVKWRQPMSGVRCVSGVQELGRG